MADNGNTEEYGIIFLPEYVKLRGKIKMLRTELSMLLLERDELVFVECKNIETAYMLSLGSLEYKAYELHCAVLRLKRKLELIRAKKNRQETVVLSAIEQTLDEEFAEYKERLDEQINKMNDALKRSRSEFLSAEETKELKKLYHTAVKALHPDLNPNESEAQAELFNSAVTAYENGDLNSLRIICSMVDDPALPERKENDMAALEKEKDRLTELLRILREEIAKIKSEYPYTMKELIRDEEKISEKKAELEDTISRLRSALESYKKRIAEILR